MTVFKRIPCFFRVAGVTLALLWWFQASAGAGIYKWVDEQGQPHYTDDKSTVPKKHRPHLKRFKGVHVKKKKVEEESAEGESEETAAPPETQASAQPPTGVAKKASEMSPEVVAMLKETITFLDHENRTYRRLIKVKEPIKANGEYYVNVVLRARAGKEKLVKKLKTFKLPSLKKARKFLVMRVVMDGQRNLGGDGFTRIKALQKRLKKGVAAKEKIIKKLQADLDTVKQ